VIVDGVVVGQIDGGLLLLVGIAAGDGPDDVTKMVDKISQLRIFGDDDGRMNRSIIDTGGSVLVVSQFTLLADVSRGRRPSFVCAAVPDQAEPLIRAFCTTLGDIGVNVATGVFGAHMEMDLINDGPVTIVIDVIDGRVV
jgi:D-tyrosyl-tRNA(Tyr) deacylase